MNKQQRDELRRLAEAATPGPWQFDSHTGWVTYGKDRLDITDCRFAVKKAGKFIAAANPAAILALLDRMDKLDKVAKAAGLISYQEKTYGCEDITFAPVMGRLREALSALEEQDDDA